MTAVAARPLAPPLNPGRGSVVMPFMVIYRTSDGSSSFEQADAIDEAALFVERLRNKEGIDEIRIYRMEEISFAFRPYYKVELGLTDRQSTPAPPSASTAVVVEEPAPERRGRRPGSTPTLPRRARSSRSSRRRRRPRPRSARPTCRRLRAPMTRRPARTVAGASSAADRTAPRRRVIPGRGRGATARASASSPSSGGSGDAEARRRGPRGRTAARRRSHHGTAVLVGGLGHLHLVTILLPRDLSRGPLVTTLGPMLPLAPTAPEAAAGGRRRRRRSPASPVDRLRGRGAAARVRGRSVPRWCPCPTWRCGPGSVRPVTERRDASRARRASRPTSPSPSRRSASARPPCSRRWPGGSTTTSTCSPRSGCGATGREAENRRYNAQLMDTSKLTAIAVALERLGEDVEITHHRRDRAPDRRGLAGGVASSSSTT